MCSHVLSKVRSAVVDYAEALELRLLERETANPMYLWLSVVTRRTDGFYSADFSGSVAGGASPASLASEGAAAASPLVGSASDDVHSV